ncbi:putative RNA-directed DNA polymerase [Rosa chinensis]|uniref:Putative RNA-directed DNA polymerase n=1 Tax=Rosa chinensis TaxID=74649 RepID=A0A2P6PZM6_ROSCH|nr:putative RNA-directed DNA polymerase [Rosa chinensis]
MILVQTGLISCWYKNCFRSHLLCSAGKHPVLSINTIVQLNGSNYKKWRTDLDLYLLDQSVDWCLTVAEPVVTNDSTDQEKELHKDWARANRICRLTIMKTLSDTVRGAIPEKALASEYLQSIAEKFTTNDKIEASMLLDKLTSMKFSMNQNMREHLMEMMNIQGQLANLDMRVDEGFFIQLAFKSLPDQHFESLKTTYNAQKDKWNLNELIAVCVQEHERIKKGKEVTVNLVAKPQWKKGKSGNQSKANHHLHKKPENLKKKKGGFKCFFCKREGHMKRDCEAYKTWKAKKGGVPKPEAAKAK